MSVKDARLFLILVCLPLSAIWSVEYFVTQDGSVHLYNAHLMLELLRGNAAVSQLVTFNSVPVPNQAGHWMLALLLTTFSAAVTVKIFVSALFVGLAASVWWLRVQVVGRHDGATGILFGTLLAFNGMWFVGAYNFTLGMVGFAFTAGLWWRWREDLTRWRTTGLSALLLLVFLSHFVAFAALVGVVTVASLMRARQDRFRSTGRTLSALLPTVPFLVMYLRAGMATAEFSPVWSYLKDPWSLAGLLSRVKDADPFLLMTRKSLPFVEAQSRWFAMLSPSLWLVLAVGCLGAATFLTVMKPHSTSDDRRARAHVWLWSGLGLFFCLAWLAGPESFGQSHGWVLRERNLLLGLICLAPAFRPGPHPVLKRVANACLLFGILIQSVAVWDYSRFVSREARELMAVRDHIPSGDAVGAIVLTRGGCRFRSNPRAVMPAFMATGTDAWLWDNYELDYYLFPVIARHEADRQSIKIRGAGGVNYCGITDDSRVTFSRLAGLLPTHYERIKVLLVWGQDQKLDAILDPWYESQPFYQHDSIRLFRRR